MDNLIWVSTTNMLIRNGSDILVMKRAHDRVEFPGWFILPGGKQEADETPLQAAVRETREETGIEPIGATLRIIATHLHDYKSKVYIVYMFEAKSFTGNLTSSSEGEAIWMDQEKLIKSPKLYPDLKRHLRLIMDNVDPSLQFTYHRFNEKLQIIEER